jgi:dienelactone hydrolase
MDAKVTDAAASALVVVTADLGEGALVVALGAGFARSAAHSALAKRLRVVAIETPGRPGAAGQALADWIDSQGVADVRLLAVGNVDAVALSTARALGGKAKAVVLVSPTSILQDASKPEKLDTAVAVLVGSRDRSQPAGALARYRQRLPGCHTVLVFDAGEDIAADRPQALADAAGDFLERQGRFILKTESVALRP